MLDYFQGWKRKVGLTTLALACVFAAGLVRSFQKENGFFLFGQHIRSPSPGMLEGTHLNRIVLNGQTAMQRVVDWQINYWYVAPPFTLLSAYFLLSPRRQPIKPRSAEEPAV